jgi:hypothetical protein
LIIKFVVAQYFQQLASLRSRRRLEQCWLTVFTVAAFKV